MIVGPINIAVSNAKASVVLQVVQEAGQMICGVYQINGKVNLPPKQWVATMRSEMKRLERIAKDAGCHEMRVAGRDWSGILLDYAPFEGVPNGLRKVL